MTGILLLIAFGGMAAAVFWTYGKEVRLPKAPRGSRGPRPLGFRPASGLASVHVPTLLVDGNGDLDIAAACTLGADTAQEGLRRLPFTGRVVPRSEAYRFAAGGQRLAAQLTAAAVLPDGSRMEDEIKAGFGARAAERGKPTKVLFKLLEEAIVDPEIEEGYALLLPERDAKAVQARVAAREQERRDEQQRKAEREQEATDRLVVMVAADGGEEVPETILLNASVTKIGRADTSSDGAQILVAQISREQAVISTEGGWKVIEDRSTYQTTYVDDAQLQTSQKVRLVHGMRIRFADGIEYEFRAGNSISGAETLK